jgi:hypothetical protein
MNLGTSSLSGFCAWPRIRRIPATTCTKMHCWRPLRTARVRWHVDQTWTNPATQFDMAEWISGSCG